MFFLFLEFFFLIGFIKKFCNWDKVIIRKKYLNKKLNFCEI